MSNVDQLAERLFDYHGDHWRPWYEVGHGTRYLYWQLARTLLDYATVLSTEPRALELRIQEELLRYGWKNPLRDAGRLVDGPLLHEDGS